MNTRMRNILVTLVTVTVLSFAAVLAVGNLTWAPAFDAGAAQTALNVEPSQIYQDDVTAGERPQIPTEDLMSQLYDAILPSVVNIRVTQASNGSPNFGIPGMPQQGQGTGWFWDNEGRIVTNNHVVEDAAEITVFFSNGRWAEAELVAADPQADLAVIKVTPPADMDLRPIPLADEMPRPGTYSLAFGSPFGLAGSMTEGIVSAVGRSFPVGDATSTGARYSLPEVVQTDAAINPGNSGGPLVNLQGELIGVNFAIQSEVRSNAGVGFAIPVSIVERVVPALIEEGAYAYPFLGIAGSTVSPQTLESEDLPEGTLGVFVGQVTQDGPSEQAGVREGDVIVGIDGVRVASFEDLIGYLLTQTEPGQAIDLQILRDGDEQTLQVTLAQRPGSQGEETQTAQITVGSAIEIATDAALNAGLLDEVESATASREDRNGRPVWIVQLGSGDREATVIVDAVDGDVLNMTVESE